VFKSIGQDLPVVECFDDLKTWFFLGVWWPVVFFPGLNLTSFRVPLVGRGFFYPEYTSPKPPFFFASKGFQKNFSLLNVPWPTPISFPMSAPTCELSPRLWELPRFLAIQEFLLVVSRVGSAFSSFCAGSFNKIANFSYEESPGLQLCSGKLS